MMIKWKVSGVEESDEGKKSQFLSLIQISISKETSKEVVKREYLKNMTGKISYNSEADETYKICVSYHGGWAVPYPALIGIKIASDNMDHPDLKNAIKNEDIDPLHKKTEEIIKNSREYIELQKHEISKEDSYAMDHMSFSRTFYYITVFQLVVIVGLGLYQVFSFKKFLASNNAF
jgi:predicted PP-loop superfamily ATPase